MCNRCGCNREVEERSCGRSGGCNRDFEERTNGRSGGCNWANEELFEVERMDRRVRDRRCCENRCAHQYNHCMRNCRGCNCD